MSTGVASADKVIADAKENMISLTESVNDIGGSLDYKFVGIDIKKQPNGDFDVVNAMKQSKGTAAQTTAGKLSDIKDVAQYTKPKK